MEKKKNRNTIFILIGFILFLAGAYALFATTLNITGTASGAGNFKIEFTNFTISNDTKASATLDSANTNLSVQANLTFPGDTVTIDFTIKNTGALAATVNNLVINENSNDDINVSIVGLTAIEGTTLNPNETTTGSIVVTWNASSTNQTPETVNFDVTIDYIQAT